MPIKSEELVRSYGLAVESNNAALFVGAGLSVSAGLPTWTALLEDLRTRAKIADSITDYPLIAQYIVDFLGSGGRGQLEDHIHSAITSGGAAPTPGHETIARIPIPEVWTTNYDRLLETAAHSARLISREEDLLNRSERSQKRIIKMHGSVSKEAQAKWDALPVITRSDFETYQISHPRMWAALQATYLTRSMLFLGFSFTDANIEILLRLSRTLKSEGHRQKEHFAVLKPPDGDRTMYEYLRNDLEQTGVAVCEVENFSDLHPLLKRIELRTRSPILFVSGSYLPDSELKVDCIELGTSLADKDLHLVSLAGMPATDLSYAFAQQKRDTGQYSADSIRFLFRNRKEVPPTLQKRLGTAVYSALEQDDLRLEAIQSARAVLVVAGGDRTLAEAEVALSEGVPVIPLAFSGGSARTIWENWSPESAFARNLTERELSLWGQLASENHPAARQAAVKLIASSMFLD